MLELFFSRTLHQDGISALNLRLVNLRQRLVQTRALRPVRMSTSVPKH
jgi:hypothetical protein